MPSRDGRRQPTPTSSSLRSCRRARRLGKTVELVRTDARPRSGARRTEPPEVPSEPSRVELATPARRGAAIAGRAASGHAHWKRLTGRHAPRKGAPRRPRARARWRRRLAGRGRCRGSRDLGLAGAPSGGVDVGRAPPPSAEGEARRADAAACRSGAPSALQDLRVTTSTPGGARRAGAARSATAAARGRGEPARHLHLARGGHTAFAQTIGERRPPRPCARGAAGGGRREDWRRTTCRLRQDGGHGSPVLRRRRQAGPAAPRGRARLGPRSARCPRPRRGGRPRTIALT